jgi:hypothetical protein
MNIRNAWTHQRAS